MHFISDTQEYITGVLKWIGTGTVLFVSPIRWHNRPPLASYVI